MNEDVTNVGAELRAGRIAAGLRQQDIADESKGQLNQQLVARVEKGELVSLRAVSAYAEVLGWEIHVILTKPR